MLFFAVIKKEFSKSIFNLRHKHKKDQTNLQPRLSSNSDTCTHHNGNVVNSSAAIKQIVLNSYANAEYFSIVRVSFSKFKPKWMNAVSSLWQQKITPIGVREGESNSEIFVLYYFCFLYRSDTMYVDGGRLQAYPSPCELKLRPVMLCLDLVRFVAFFISLPLAALIMSIRIAWQQDESQNIYRIYWVSRDKSTNAHIHPYMDGCKQNHQVTWMNANER